MAVTKRRRCAFREDWVGRTGMVTQSLNVIINHSAPRTIEHMGQVVNGPFTHPSPLCQSRTPSLVLSSVSCRTLKE